MRDDQSKSVAGFFGIGRFVPRLVWGIAILVIFAIPARIITYGYLPEDDSLRYAAKAVSGKPWSEILVLGAPQTVDQSFGWHVFLRQIYLWTQCDAERLVDLSVLVLFALIGCAALPWLKHPEAWLGSLLLLAAGWPQLVGRLMIGRPLLVTTYVLLTLLFLGYSRGASLPNLWTIAGMAALIAAAVFVNEVWYLWALPIAAFLLARQYRWAVALAIAWLLGTVLGAALTGHPLEYVSNAVRMAIRVPGIHPTQRTLVPELQPASGGIFVFFIVGGLLAVRQWAGLKARPLTANPAFWMAALGWVLGFIARRFWVDWGLASLMVLVACDLQSWLQTKLSSDSPRRLALAGCLALSTYLVFTSDIDSRWTRSLTRQYLRQDDPELAGWLPDKGGIFYAADPSFFYETFLKNPNADWRYILGFEMALMPDEDFKILHDIVWNFGTGPAYKPWADKMRPEDRLFVRADAGTPPPIPGLEWHYTLGGMWSGRLPRASPLSTTPGASGSIPHH